MYNEHEFDIVDIATLEKDIAEEKEFFEIVLLYLFSK